MKRKIIAIMDREEGYAARLMEVFNSKNRMGFQAELYTSEEAFCQQARERPFEILLIGEGLLSEKLEKMASMVVVISEGTKVAEQNQHPIVYKYQSAELIIRKVMGYYAEFGGQPDVLCRPGMKIYGVYAPQEHADKSRFAWNLARSLGKTGSVLYLNLTAFSGMKELFQQEKDLADLMYYVRHGFDNLIYLVGSMVVSVEGIDCMPGMKTVDDLLHVPGEDWRRLLRVIGEQSNYDAVVLDVEECVQQYIQLLELCSEVYLPFVGGRQETAAWELCEAYFKRMGAEELWKKGKKLELERSCWRSDMESIINS